MANHKVLLEISYLKPVLLVQIQHLQEHLKLFRNHYHYFKTPIYLFKHFI